MVRRSRRLPIPGPQGWPIIGNMFQIDQKFPHQILEKWGKQFDGIYQICVIKEDWVVVTKYEYVYEMLVTKSYAFAGRQDSFRLSV